MHRNLLTISTAIAILSMGSLVSLSADARAKPNAATARSATQNAAALHFSHRQRTARHAVQPPSDITSFSSSSGLNVAVTHRPGK